MPAPAGAATVRKVGVCHIASADLWAGAEVQIATLLRALAGSGEVRLLAIFFNEGRLAEEARAAGAEVHIFPESRKNFWGILLAAGRCLRGRQIDVLHAHGYKANLLALLLSRQRHIPWVVRTQHGAAEPFTGWRLIKNTFFQWLDRIVMRYGTDRVIAVSGELRRRMEPYLNARHLVTIPNGIDVSAVRSALSPAEARQRLGLPAECPVIGTAGRLVPVKRLDILVRAAAQVARELPGARLVIAGQGPEEPGLRKLAAACGIADRVLFLGHRDDIHDVLRAMDLFVLCSDHEGLPMVLLEALGLGLPVVARPVGGVAEVTEDGRSAVWVRSAEPAALAEACLALLRDPARRSALAAAGAERVARCYSAGQAGAATAALYHSLCRSRSD